MEKNSELSELPEEVEDSMQNLDVALEEVETKVGTLMKVKLQDLKSKLKPLETVKADIVMTYAMNSLFWSYLVTQGVDPKNHPVKQELDRIRKYMQKVKELEDKEKAARIDKAAAGRFIKHSLAANNKDNPVDVDDIDENKSSKRKTESEHGKSKKKKRKTKQE